MSEPLSGPRLEVQYNSLRAEHFGLCLRLAEETLALQQRDELRYHRDMAEKMKRELDAKTRLCWQVVVGTSFGWATTVEKASIASFTLGSLFFAVWK